MYKYLSIFNPSVTLLSNSLPLDIFVTHQFHPSNIDGSVMFVVLCADMEFVADAPTLSVEISLVFPEFPK